MSNDKSQKERFKEAARKAGADESDDALDLAFGKLKIKAEPEGERPAKPAPKERLPSDKQR